MAIISCPECGKQVSDRAVSCPECGCPISAVPAVPVQNNTAEEVSKLLVLARRAREGSDSKNAKKYYDQILDKDPGNWEAIFYSVYYEASECKIMYIASAANSVANCIYSTFSAIGDLQDEDEKDNALNSVILSASVIATMFVTGAVNHYNQFSTTNNAYSECSGRVVAAGNIYSEIETSMKKVFPDKKERLADFQKAYVAFLKNNTRWYNDNYRLSAISRLEKEIAAVYPVYGQKKELENKIASLDRQICSLVTKQTTAGGCLGPFFLIVGGIMFVLGMVLMSVEGGFWPVLVAIPEFVIGVLCMRKKPSMEEVNANIQKKAELTRERDALKKQLDALGE